MNGKHPYSNAPVFRVIVMIMKEVLPEWPDMKEIDPMSHTRLELYDYLRNISKECWKSNPKERPQLKEVQATLLKKIKELGPKLDQGVPLYDYQLIRETARMLNWRGNRPPVKKALFVSIAYSNLRDREGPQYNQLYIPYVRCDAEAVQLFLNGTALQFL